MKVISVHRVMLQFDADQVTHGTNEQQTDQAVAQINALLQREPYGLGAQLFALHDEIEIESDTLDDE